MTIDTLTDILGYRLSDEQLTAVTADLDQPLRVVAGAGSGKTTVMAARVVWAVGTGHVSPEQVLGLTFTTKAAAELGARVRGMLAKLEGGDAHGEINADALVTTYHSFAHALVTEHGLRIGVEPGLRILTEDEVVHLAYRTVANTNLELHDIGIKPSMLVKPLLALDQQLAEHVVSPARLREHDIALAARVAALPKTVAADRQAGNAALRRIELSRLVEELREAKLSADGLDFADQLRFGVRLATEVPEVGTVSRDRWRLVLLDEYQDTSFVQAQLLAGMFGQGHSTTAVGDPMQAIYGWRGASLRAMEDFPETFHRRDATPARTCELRTSHRSGPRILAAANAIAQPLRDKAPVVILEPHVDPADGSMRADGLRLGLFDTHVNEVAWLAERLSEQIEHGRAPEQIAVLCRARGDFLPIAHALELAGVPYLVAAVEGLLAQPEVADVVSLLEVIHDPTANAAMLRILLGPRWRIGARDLAILGRRAADLSRADTSRIPEGRSVDTELDRALDGIDVVDVVSLIEAVDDPGSPDKYRFSGEARQRFGAVSAELQLLRAAASQPLADLVHLVVNVIGLDVEVLLNAAQTARFNALAQYDRGLAALADFVELVSGFSDIDGDSSLGGFLAWLEMADRFDASPKVDVASHAGAVQLLTVHKAKGLEWEVVAVPFLSNGTFPSSQGRAKWTARLGELPHALRGDRDGLPDLYGFGTTAHKVFAEAMAQHSEEEERRLAYVAVTRPAQLLLASGHWWGPTQAKPRGPSSYLNTLRETALETDGFIDTWAPEPGEATNPALDGVTAYEWPITPNPAVADEREWAAQSVRAALADAEPIVGADDEEGLTASDIELVRQWDADAQLLLAERNTAETPQQVVLPSSLSATDVLALTSDPASYAKQLSRPMPKRPSRAARKGTRFHDWVEQRFGERPLFEELPSVDDEEVSDADLESLKVAFLKTEFADRAPFAVEVPFALVVAGRIVRGRIDAVYSVGDKWQVVDWKTNKEPDSDPLQLAIYRAAWAQIQAVAIEDVQGAFVYVRRGEVEFFDDLPGPDDLALLLG